MTIAANFPAIRPSLNLDFANSKVLDPRITFGRASTATFYDGKTVAKAEENLLTYSQQFDNAVWVKANASVMGDASVAPDGATTADKLIGTGENPAITAPAGTLIGSYVLSVFAKAGELSWLRLSNQVASNSAWFNLGTGAVGTVVGAGNTASLQNMGNGWYRCILTIAAAIDTGNDITIACTNADNTTTGYTGDGASGIYIWGAQLEKRSQVTAYTPTTTQPITNYIPVLQTAAANVARFDHNPITGESLGLLIEEQRTNLLTNSEFQGGIVGSGSSVLSEMFGPSGSYVKAMAFPAGNMDVYRYRPGAAENTQYTLSVFVKMDDGLSPNFGAAAGSSSLNDFTLVIGGVLVNPTTYSVVHVGNGTYRVSGTATSGTTVLQNTGISRYASNSGRGFKSTGWQLEAGAFPTSYIKTEASQVTRAADAASMTGANFSSWYRQDEGTLYAEIETQAPLATSGIFSVNDGTSANQIGLRFQSTSIRLLVNSNATAQAAISIGATPVAGTFYRVSSSYKLDSFAISQSGANPVSDNSGVLPVVSRALIGSLDASVYPLTGHIKKIAYYPKALPNNLQALTA